jgi:hypothetical protein
METPPPTAPQPLWQECPNDTHAYTEVHTEPCLDGFSKLKTDLLGYVQPTEGGYMGVAVLMSGAHFEIQARHDLLMAKNDVEWFVREMSVIRAQPELIYA